MTRILAAVVVAVFPFPSPSASAETIEVIAFTGQSNSLGLARNSEYALRFENYPQIEIHASRQYNGSYRESPTESVRMGDRFGGEWSFAKRLAEIAYRDGFYAFLSTGRGGISASRWNPFRNSHPEVDNFANYFYQLKSRIETDHPRHSVKIGAVVFQQGERDAAANLSPVHWKSDVQQFAVWVRENYGSDIPFFFPSLTTMQEVGYSPEGVQNIRRQQWEITQPGDLYYVPNSHYIELDPISSHIGDDIHYSVTALDEIGLLIFDAFASVKAIINEPAQINTDEVIDAFHRSPEGFVTIGWPTEPGLGYVIDYSENAELYFPLTGKIKAYGWREDFIVSPSLRPPPILPPSRFYRVEMIDSISDDRTWVPVSQIRHVADGMALTWNSAVGQEFVVSYSETLEGDDYLLFPEPIIAKSESIQFTDSADTLSAAGDARFFRVRKIAEP